MFQRIACVRLPRERIAWGEITQAQFLEKGLPGEDYPGHGL